MKMGDSRQAIDLFARLLTARLQERSAALRHRTTYTAEERSDNENRAGALDEVADMIDDVRGQFLDETRSWN